MTEIVYTCECGKTYRFHDRFSGRASRCIQCKREYTVPMVSETISSEASETFDENETPILGVSFHSGTDSEVGSSGETFDPLIEVLSTPYPETPGRSAKKIVLGKFEIRDKLGEGGMGNVFSAWDMQLHREVTVKVLNQRSKKHHSYKERFVNEARITGKLAHSGIIPVYSLDYDSKGNPYYTMRLLEGRTLEQLIQNYHNPGVSSFSPDRLRELLRHFIDVCHTMAYAHDNRVVHRDLKPSNIMLGGYGETIVLDWGLAKTLTGEPEAKSGEESSKESPEGDEESSTRPETEEPNESDEETVNLTMQGTRVGTLGYQSPEYLKTGISTVSDDIYALGAVLYFILCNKLPFKLTRNARGLFDMMMSSPPYPHLINPHVDRPLTAICLCALAFEKEKRYRSAADLADDLQRWLDGETVAVYRMEWKEKIVFFLRKNVLVLGVAVATFLIGFLLAKLIV